MKTIANLYAEARRAGYHAAGAIRAARIVAEFDEAESADLVRIAAESEQEGYFDVYGEPEGYTNGHGRRVTAEQERAEIVASIDRDGCWVVCAQVKRGCETCGREEWETVDSVGMCTGYADPTDWRQNGYVVDLMAAALEHVAKVSA